MTMPSVQRLSEFWGSLEVGKKYRTPDNSRGRSFTIEYSDATTMSIKTEGGSLIPIKRMAFEAALKHLADGMHDVDNPCRVGSRYDQPGTLSRAASEGNGSRTVVIQYILPILHEGKFVGVYGGKPRNTAWLAA